MKKTNRENFISIICNKNLYSQENVLVFSEGKEYEIIRQITNNRVPSILKGYCLINNEGIENEITDGENNDGWLKYFSNGRPAVSKLHRLKQLENVYGIKQLHWKIQREQAIKKGDSLAEVIAALEERKYENFIELLKILSGKEWQ